jgi:meso-butanediol dehydrogenase/(S,S)-butanediol dehydrogenase/diacetyl reductase
MGQFEGRVALVTGAGSGIGRVVARELASEGAMVVATDVTMESAAATAQGIGTDIGRQATARGMDVTNGSQVATTVEEVTRTVGDISLLVNCAGVSSMFPFVELPEDEWDRNMDVNAKGVFLVTQSVLRHMVPKKYGSVVSIASAAAKGGGPLLAHYAASKWAVIGLTQSVAREVAGDGVRVNAVCPGFVRTPMQDREVAWEAERRGIDPEDVRRGYVQYTPLGRLCEPEDVADVIVFLCSEKARFMTGQAVNVTGGLVMH